MLPPNKARDLALGLVAREAEAGAANLQTQPATVRVYERLRQQLGALVGVGGFQVVAARALALAKSQSPRLGAVQTAANGALRGLDEVEAGADESGEAGIVVIAELLGLFLTFLGETTTLRLMEDLHLQVEAQPAPGAIGADPAAAAPDGSAMDAAFNALLLEIDRLKNVGGNIEALARKYPGMEEGLMSVAGNIHSIATILDIFTLIRSKAGGRVKAVPPPPADGYVH